MLHPVHYLISPKTGLIGVLTQANDEGLNDFVEPLLWTATEPDRTSFSRSDGDALAKILFVDRVIRERSDAPAFDQVFNGLSATTDCFDKYWTLLRVLHLGDVDEELEECLKYWDVDSFIPTGSDGLDEYLIESKRRWSDRPASA